jgi:hypothetical protein
VPDELLDLVTIGDRLPDHAENLPTGGRG